MIVLDLSPLTLPQGLGVNIHFTDPAPGEMARLAGPFRVARMDFAWGSTERAKGVYDFAAYDRLLAAMAKAGVRPYWILDYGNDLYGEGSPRTPAQRDAFCRWVAAAMAHFRDHGIVWETWNEPNIGFWKPRPSVEEYVLLARAVGETVRRAAPRETLVGPATSGFDWPFLQRCLDAGLLKYWDAVSVHPYRQGEPESVEADWLRLRAMLDRAAPGRNVPMVSGEWGYSEAWSGMTRERQAEYAARAYLTNLRCGVPISVWYDWKDDGPDPKDAESRFGSVEQDLAPKPAYDALTRLGKDLAGYTFVTRLESDDGRWTLLFRKDESTKLVLWTTGEPKTIRLLGRSVAVGHGPQTIEADSNALRNLRPLPWVRYAPDAVFKPHGDDYAVVAVGDAAYVQNTHTQALRPLRLHVEPGRKGDTFAVLENPYGHAPITSVLEAYAAESPVSYREPGVPAARFPIAPQTPFPMRVRLPRATQILKVPLPGVPVSAFVPRFVDLSLDGATAATDGDPKVRGGASATKTPDGLRFAYDADPGWRFAELHPKDGAAEGRPTAYGIWARGDGSGASLVMRYTDATGQTFQPVLGTLDGTDWRYVSAPLDGSGGHWGGANDGTVHWPIRVSTLALIELPDRRGGPSAVLLARPTLAYDR